MKRYVSMFLVLILAIALMVGCGSTEQQSTGEAAPPEEAAAPAEEPTGEGEAPAPAGNAKENGELVFGVTLAVGTNPFHQLMQQGMEETLSPGQSLIVTDANQDQAKQISDIEDMIQQGVDVMLVDPVDSKGVTAALEACQRAGIPVIAFNSPVDDVDLVVSTVASDNVMAGELCADALAAAMGGEGAVAMYNYSLPKVARERSEGFEARMAEQYPNIEIVNRQEGLPSVDAALPIMENILQTNPEITGVFALNDPAAIGCIAAIESAGLLDQIAVVGVDGSDDGKDMIRQGKMLASAAQFPKEIARITIETAYRHLDGESVDVDVKVPVELVDATNVD